VGRGSFHVVTIGSERKLDAAMGVLRDALHQGFILSRDRVLFKLHRKPAMRGLCFRHDHDARGVFV